MDSGGNLSPSYQVEGGECGVSYVRPIFVRLRTRFLLRRLRVSRIACLPNCRGTHGAEVNSRVISHRSSTAAPRPAMMDKAASASMPQTRLSPRRLGRSAQLRVLEVHGLAVQFGVRTLHKIGETFRRRSVQNRGNRGLVGRALIGA